MQKISLIFPMAGQGARFGYRFKPFLEVGGESFIKAAFAPFRPWLERIDKVYFVFTAEQEKTHNVRARLDTMFAGVPHASVVIAAPTQGPAETLLTCLKAEAITGPILVCDCDHAVEADGLMTAAFDSGAPCAVPTWPLDGEKLSAWSVAAVEQDGRISAVAEKSLPPGDNFRGIIGCYYFSDAARVRRMLEAEGLIYISDLVRAHLEAGVISVPVREARFFGDPARLAALAS